MDISEELDKLFDKRSVEFIEKYNSNRLDNEKVIFTYLESLVSEKYARYIVISPLCSSFITQTYEYMLAVYGEELYLSNTSNSVYIVLPLMREHIVEDLKCVDSIVNNMEDENSLEDYERHEMKYQYSLRYLDIVKPLWKDIALDFIEYIKAKDKVFDIQNLDIIYGMYMERTESFISKESI
jgi:hypothetical protein